MASKYQASATLFVSLNLLFFVIVNAQYPATPIGNVSGNASGSGNGNGNGGGNSGGCPRDALKLGVCANLLGGLVGPIIVGSPPTLPCCTLITGLADLEAAICLCTAIRANVLGINLNVPISLSLVLNNCGRQVPNGFTC